MNDSEFSMIRACQVNRQKILGLDLGSKAIGVAIADAQLLIASPLTTIKNQKFTETAKLLLKLIEQNRVGALVIGLPLELSGTEGRRCQSVRQFGRNFAKLSEIALVFCDERLSTAVVLKAMIHADQTRQHRDRVIDQAAAAYILQGALDQFRHRFSANHQEG